jgi:hypothetical protein
MDDMRSKLQQLFDHYAKLGADLKLAGESTSTLASTADTRAQRKADKVGHSYKERVS